MFKRISRIRNRFHGHCRPVFHPGSRSRSIYSAAGTRTNLHITDRCRHGKFRRNGSHVQCDDIVLIFPDIRHAGFIRIKDQRQPVSFLHPVCGRLQINGVIPIYAFLRRDLSGCGSGFVTGVRIAQIHPSAGNNRIGLLRRNQFHQIIILQTAALPEAAFFQRLLIRIGRHGIERVHLLSGRRQFHQHSADHQGIAFAERRFYPLRIGNSRTEMHGDGTLDDGLFVNVRRIHGADLRHAVSENQFVRPVSVSHLRGGIIAVKRNGFAVLLFKAGHRQGFLAFPAVVRNPYIFMAVLRGDFRHVFDSVVDPVQIMAEPPVQQFVIDFSVDLESEFVCRMGGGMMSVLMQKQLHVRTGFPVRPVHHFEMLGSDIVVRQTVNDQGRAPDFFRIQRVIADVPRFSVISVEYKLILPQLFQIGTVFFQNRLPVLFVEIASGTVARKVIQIRDTAPRRYSLRICVFVPACDARNGNDGLETFHTGRRQSKLCGSGVGTSGHPDFPAAPFRFDRDIAGLVGVGDAVAVQPLDHAFERIGFMIVPAGFESFRTQRTDPATFDHGKAAYQIIVIPGQIFVFVLGFLGIPVIPFRRIGVLRVFHRTDRFLPVRNTRNRLTVQQGHIVAFAAHLLVIPERRTSRDVGTCFVNHGRLIVSFGRRAWNLHQGLHQIQFSVVVRVIIGLHVDKIPDNLAVLVAVARFDRTGGIRKDRLCFPVQKQRHTGIHRRLYLFPDVQHCRNLCFRDRRVENLPVFVVRDNPQTLGEGIIIVRIIPELFRFQTAAVQNVADGFLHRFSAQNDLLRFCGNDRRNQRETDRRRKQNGNNSFLYLHPVKSTFPVMPDYRFRTSFRHIHREYISLSTGFLPFHLTKRKKEDVI